MFCTKCGSEIADGAAFCTSCGAPAGGGQGASAPGSSTPPMNGTPPAAASAKRGGAKVGIIAAAAVVAAVLVVGLATDWFGLAGVQPKEAVEVPAAAQPAPAVPAEPEPEAPAEPEPPAPEEQAGGAQPEVGEPVKSAVEAYTWDELSRVSAKIAAAGGGEAAIEVAKRYNLCNPDGTLDGAQVKSVALSDGRELLVQIVGFAHDDRTGGGKAGITFAFAGCLASAPMNATAASAGGWEASQMRSWLEGAAMGLLPEDLASAIVPVDKLTNNVGDTDSASSVTATSDRLWLLSAAEICGPVDWYEQWDGSMAALDGVLSAEGSQYQLFRDAGVGAGATNAVLVRELGAGPATWWERTPGPVGDDGFYAVSYEGYPADFDYADLSNAVVPGFCI